MKKKIQTITAIIVVLVLIAWGSDSLNSKPLELAENIPVEEFTSVSIAVNATVFIKQGNSCNLDIDAPADVIEKLEIKVENNKLLIKPESYTTRITEEINISIEAPDYEVIDLAGSGIILSEGKMKLNELELNISGNGEMVFDDLSAGEVEAKISGSGKMSITGEGAEEMEISIAGSGDFIATDFKVRELDVKLSGSGNCEVFVTDELEATIAGSGSIYYRGNPDVDSTVAGSGKVREID